MVVDVKQKLADCIEKIEKEDKKINSFLSLNDDAFKEAGKSKGRLAGKVISVKANINVKGLVVSCASKTLEDYKATYDAGVISRIKQEGGLIVGVVNMDEFACGSSGETSAFGPVRNPRNEDLIAGGSSSGSAASVGADFCEMALGSDTGGSIRNPASHCGVVGVKPTYGSVSRYGLIDLSMSLDQIGPIAKNVSDAALLLSVIQGQDARDTTTIHGRHKEIDLKKIEKKPQNLAVGILDISDLEIDSKIQDLFDDRVKQITKKNKWQVKKVKIPNINLAVQTYYPLVYVEFFSGTRRFDGRKYGKKIEDFAGAEVLRRIFGGAEISKSEFQSRYYYQALKVKKFIENEFLKAFKKVDCILSPVVPKLPHKIGSKISVEEMYGYDALTIPANLVGNCAVSVPLGEIEGIPAGVQIMCDKFQDEKMLRIARAFEKFLCV